jgi:hypothetical protein
MSATKSVDEVVGGNLRRLREAQKPRKWSRKRLAEEYNRIAPPGSREWNRWRVEDLERSRPGRSTAPILWSELVTLCIVFGVLLWDLVLPAEGEEVTIAKVFRDADGWRLSSTNYLEGPELGRILSGIPADYLADREAMKRLVEKSGPEALTMDQILQQQEGLQASIDQLVAMTERVGGESVPGDDSSEGTHGEHS